MNLPSIVTGARGSMEQAAAVTYTGSTSAVVFWGLHISDLAAIVSMAVAICGLLLQFYVAMRRIERVERTQAHVVARQDVAESRADVAESRADVAESRADAAEVKAPISAAAAAITAATVAAARLRKAERAVPVDKQ